MEKVKNANMVNDLLTRPSFRLAVSGSQGQSAYPCEVPRRGDATGEPGS